MLLSDVRRAGLRDADLVAAAALAVLAGVFAVFDGIPTPLRILVAVPLVFAVPGYALTEALLPGRSTRSTGRSMRSTAPRPVERVLLAVALSITVSVLGGLLLNLLPAGLTRNTQTMLLSVVALGSAAAAAVRRGRVESGERADGPPAPRGGRLSPAGILSLVLALVLASAAIAIGVRTAQAHDSASFTQLWITVDPSGTRGQIGVTNDEGTAESYSLGHSAAGRPGRTFAFRLANGATWQTEIALPADAKGYPLTVRLYRSQAPGVVYREVSLGSSPS